MSSHSEERPGCSSAASPPAPITEAISGERERVASAADSAGTERAGVEPLRSRGGGAPAARSPLSACPSTLSTGRELVRGRDSPLSGRPSTLSTGCRPVVVRAAPLAPLAAGCEPVRVRAPSSPPMIAGCEPVRVRAPAAASAPSAGCEPVRVRAPSSPPMIAGCEPVRVRAAAGSAPLTGRPISPAPPCGGSSISEPVTVLTRCTPGSLRSEIGVESVISGSAASGSPVLADSAPERGPLPVRVREAAADSASASLEIRPRTAPGARPPATASRCGPPGVRVRASCGPGSAPLAPAGDPLDVCARAGLGSDLGSDLGSSDCNPERILALVAASSSSPATTIARADERLVAAATSASPCAAAVTAAFVAAAAAVAAAAVVVVGPAISTLASSSSRPANAASSGSNGAGTAAKLCDTRAPYAGVFVRRFDAATALAGCTVMLRDRRGRPAPVDSSISGCTASITAASRGGT